MPRDDRVRKLRHLGPLLVMICGALAIAIVVLGVLWIGDQPFSERLPSSLAEGARP
jgi:hypothetical protein